MEFKKFIKYNGIRLLISMFIILIPFNNLPYLNNVLKELSFFASSYIILILLVIFFYKIIKDKDVFKYWNKLFTIFAMFLGWGLVSAIVNAPTIYNNMFKGKSGIKRFAFQYPLIVFSFIVAYALFYFIKKEKINIYMIRKYILISALLTGFYSIFEVLYLLNILDTSFILEKVSSIIQIYCRGEIYSRGVRGVTGEASYFAMYAAFVFPWLFSYIYTEKKIWNKLSYSIFNVYFIMLIFLSKSRIGLAVFTIEFVILILGIFIIKNNKQFKIISVTILVSILMCGLLVNNIFYKNNSYENTAKSLSISGLIQSLKDKNNLSNVARFSLQEAALDMGLAKPIVGVGVGQFAFHVTDNIESDAYRSFEIKDWLDPNNSNYWPTVFSLHIRIIGEVGFVGFAIWAIMWILVLYKLIKKFLLQNQVIVLAIIVSTIGVLFACMNLDTFIYYPLWILLAVVASIENKERVVGDDYEF